MLLLFPNNFQICAVKIYSYNDIAQKHGNVTVKDFRGEVKIVIQMEDGSRHQDMFTPDTTLFDILIATGLSLKRDIPLKNAVCVCMSNEYKSLKILKSTSLKTIGLVSGGALIRLLFRGNISNEGDASDHSSSGTKHNISEGYFPLKEPSGKEEKLENLTLFANGPTGGEIIQQDHCENPVDQKNKAHAVQRLYTTGPPPCQLFPEPLHERDNVISEDRNYKMVASTQAFQLEFANFKFPEMAAMGGDIVPIDPKDMKLEVELAMPCKREPTIFSKKIDDDIVAVKEDMDDAFFEVTIDDLRKRINGLKYNRDKLGEAVLMTKVMRKKEELQRIAHFEKIPIRFQFPDKVIVQGLFRPLEPISRLKKFIEEFLGNSVSEYELFTTPPKTVLTDKQQTLYEAKLIPAAVVHVSVKDFKGSWYLKEDCYNKLKTFKEVQHILQRGSRKKSEKCSVNSAMSDNKTESRTPNVSSNVPSASNVRGKSASGNPKGTPKWFKTGR